MSQPARDPSFLRYLATQKKYDAELARTLEASARDIQRRLRLLKIQEGIGAQVRAAQLRVTLAAINNELTDMWHPGVLDIVVRGSKSAAMAAEVAIETLSRVTYASLPDAAAEALTKGLRASAQAGIDTLYKRVPRRLSNLVWNDAALSRGAVDDLIRRGLAQGLSAKELSQTVYRFVSPTAPGGVSYSAQRLARTEINNAFHQQQIALADMPGVEGVKWNLSGSHPRPDQCNDYAEGDHDGMGAGVFATDNVPNKPHPNCFCYLTYVTMDAKQFVSALSKGKFDDELRRRIARNVDLITG
jgi:hypothetical protein